MAAYDFIDQSIVSTCLVQPHNNDSFYNPVSQEHTGFAADGQFYQNGDLLEGHRPASWFSEPFGPYRGNTQTFPTYGLILLSKAALTILDESTPVAQSNELKLWMLFLLSDNFALANNFNGQINGWTPAAINYADGVISITYNPDDGNQVGGDPPSVDSHMVVTLDFTQDSVYLDVAV